MLLEMRVSDNVLLLLVVSTQSSARLLILP